VENPKYPQELDDDDRRRDEGLLRMLKTPPVRNEKLKLGNPRNPQQKKKSKETKKPGR
jgi:hypothetical protein